MNPIDDTHDAEERAILAALGTESISSEGGSRDETEATFDRLYVEVLGLVPYSLDPIAPSASGFEQVLAQIESNRAPEAPQEAQRPLATVVPIAERIEERTRERVERSPAAAAAVPSRSARGLRFAAALAAVLALAFLGSTLWLHREWKSQDERIADLEQQLLSSQEAVQKARAAGVQFEDLQKKFQLVTATTVEITPLRPPTDAPVQPGARGLLFVAADHQHWHLSLEGLAPAGTEQRYQLWFLAESGPVSAGTFTAAPGAPVSLSSEHMPAGTRGVLVTLEPQQGSPLPNGPEILRAG